MQWLTDLLGIIQKFIEDNWSGLAVLLWGYEEGKIAKEQSATRELQTELQIEKNHEAVDEKYSGVADVDVVRDAITQGGGDNGQLETDNEVDPTNTNTKSDSSN